MFAQCPTCSAAFDDNASYVAHLERAHGLADDPGTTHQPGADSVASAAPGIPDDVQQHLDSGQSGAAGGAAAHTIAAARHDERVPAQKDMPPWVAAVVIGAVLVSLAAWMITQSGSSDSSAPPRDPTSTTAPLALVAPDGSKVEPAVIASVNVQLRDLPGEWTSSPPRNDTAADEAVNKAAMACLGVEDPSAQMEVKSNFFRSADNLTNLSSDVMYSNASVAHEYEAAIATPSGRDCLQQALQDAVATGDDIPAGITVDSVDLSSPQPLAAGEEGSVFGITMRMSSQGKHVVAYQRLYSFRVGPIVVETVATATSPQAAGAVGDPPVAGEVARAQAAVG
jgi:hypothetical protein